MDKLDLLMSMKELPVFDMHEHFESYGELHGYDMPRFLYQNSYLNLFAAALPKELAAVIDDPGLSAQRHFDALLEIDKIAAHTACGRFLRRLVKYFGVEKLSPESFEPLSERFNARTQASVAALTPTIKATVANSLGHPLYGYCRGIEDYLDAPPERPESVLIQLCVTPLHCIHGERELLDLEYVYGNRIASYEEWECAVESIIARCLEMGVAGFKDVYMFYRSFDIEKPDEAAAKRQFAALLKGERAPKALLDSMLYKIYAIMSETGLSAAVHTGCSIDTCESAMHMRPVIELMKAYPNMRFDLLHLNYPKLEDYMVALKSCPNAYANCAWTPTFDCGYAEKFLSQAVDTLLVSDVSLFGGDRHCPGEPVACSLDITLEVLTNAMHRLIEQGTLAKSDALEIAVQWLYDNPKRMFTKT